MKINKKIASILLSAAVATNIFALDFQVGKTNDISSAVKKIQSSKLKNTKADKYQMSKMLRSYAVDNASNFTFDSTRDTMNTVSFTLNGQNISLLLVSNRVQNDPTKVGKTAINISNLNQSTGYICKGGGGSANCGGEHFYTNVAWNSNSVGAKIILTQNALDNAKNGEIVLLDRNYQFIDESTDVRQRVIKSRQNTLFNKPFFKVYIDKEGYLNAKFTRITGGTSVAKTNKPIPLNEEIYIQANQNKSTHYEVSWKNARTNEVSSGKNAHQTPLSFDNFQADKLTQQEINLIGQSVLPIANTGFKSTNFQDSLINARNDLSMQNYFWGANVPMFANIDKDVVDGAAAFQESARLIINNELIAKILADIFNNQDNFNPSNMRIYIDANQNIVAVDIRQNFK